MDKRKIIAFFLCLFLAFPAYGEVFMQKAFNAGELSPRLKGRVEIEQYGRGLATCLNAMVQPHGGVEKRPGFKYIASTKTSSTESRLIPFIFSTTQAYILEFGDYYIRFYMDGGQIASGGSAYEIATPYRDEDVMELQWAQSADTMYLVHPYYSPRKLTRTGHTAWTLTVVSFSNLPSDWGQKSLAITAITKANPGQVTSAGHSLSNGDTVLITNVVGMTEVNGSTYTVTTVDADNFTIGTDTSGYTAYDSGGYWNETDQPAAVTFHEERLVFGGVPSHPQTIYASKNSDFEDMGTGANDGDGLDFTIAADQVNVIRWLKSVDKLLIGTTGGEWWMSGSGSDDAITPSNVKVRRESTYGSQWVIPEAIGDKVFFVQKPGRTVREYGYNEDDGFTLSDMTILSEHLTCKYGIIDLAYQQIPWQILWAVRSDGALLGMTYNPDHEVYGWHRHTTGDLNDGLFESIAVIPGDDFDELWAIVKRRVNGSWYRYIEELQDNEWSIKTQQRVIPAGAGTVAVEINSAYDDFQTWCNTYYGSACDTECIPGDEPHGIAFQDESSTTARMGYYNSAAYYKYICKGWYTFDSVDIPQGATITSAKIRFMNSGGYTAGDTNVKMRIYCEDADTATVLGSWGTNTAAEVNALDLTTEYSTWRLSGDIDDGANFYTTDFGSAVEEVVGRSGWETGNNLRVHFYTEPEYFHDFDTCNYSLMNNVAVYGYANSGSPTGDYVPQLEVEYYTDEAIYIEDDTLTHDAFYVDSGLTYKDDSDIEDVDRTNPVNVQITSHGYSTGDEVYIYGLVGCGELNGRTFEITVVDTDNFTLDDEDGTNFYSEYISGGSCCLGAVTFSGLSHLEGETVGVYADGEVLDDEIVTGGSITLDDTHYVLHAGLKYDTDIETLPVTAGDGTIQAQTKRLTEAVVRVHETLSDLQIGPDTDNLDTITITSLTTGDERIRPFHTYETDGSIFIRAADPAPFTLLSTILDVELY